MEPFLGRMRAAALSARPDGDCRQADGERNVGVSRGAVKMRADAEVRVHCAHALQNVSVIGKASARPRSDFFYFGGDLAARRAIVLRFERAFHAACENA